MDGDGPKSQFEMKWITNKDTEMYEKSLVLRE